MNLLFRVRPSLCQRALPQQQDALLSTVKCYSFSTICRFPLQFRENSFTHGLFLNTYTHFSFNNLKLDPFFPRHSYDVLPPLHPHPNPALRAYPSAPPFAVTLLPHGSKDAPSLPPFCLISPPPAVKQPIY